MENSISQHQLLRFIKAYVKSMRPYYAFVTGIPGWVGVAFYEHIATDFGTVEIMPSVERKFATLLLLFLSWGINQIINDFLGRAEDRINAPHRPMVSGELHVGGAMGLSAALILATGFITWFYLEPVALIPLIIGVFMNILYEYAKGYGIWGNIIFGLMISMCPVFGYLASGPVHSPYFTSSRLAIWGLIWLINSLMTYYTYFKDYKGDKRAGKRTIIVKYGLRKASILGVAGALLPLIYFISAYRAGFIVARVNRIFIILGMLSVFLEIWTAVLYYVSPIGKRTYYSLATNFRACICAQASIIALFNTELALILFIVSYVFVGFLFDLYPDAKA